MSDTPFQPTGESDPSEARIVAWVLGESPAAEAAELERLCDERPELRAFRDRIREINGLLAEAEAADPGPAWQLPAAKRLPFVAAPRRKWRRFPWMPAALAACLALMATVAALFPSSGQKNASPLAEAKAREDFADDTAPAPAPDAVRAPAADEETIRTNPALDYKHPQNVDKVRSLLYTAEGSYNLGKYDDAKKSYELALRIDPYNNAARRGLEVAAARKSAYHRAAYDETRAEMLMEADKAWGGSLPTQKATAEMPSRPNPPAESGQAGDLAMHSSQEGKAKQPIAEVSGGAAKSSSKPASRGKAKQPIAEASEAAAPPANERNGRDKSNAPLESNLRQLASPTPPRPLNPETAVADNPYSTFSLNVSDVSFKTAVAAMANGETPDPASIRVEQFYNAMDYGDPTPLGDEPVAVRIEQCADPVLPGRDLVRIALRTASAGRATGQPLNLTLLIDESGSMARPDRKAALSSALGGLAKLLTANDRVTVMGFALSPTLLADSVAGNEFAQVIPRIDHDANEGGTNLESALDMAAQTAAGRIVPGSANRVVLFTDGAANLGDADPQRLSRIVESMRTRGLAFDVAGIGTSELNDTLLEELARHGNGRFQAVESGGGDDFARRLAGAFRPAAENVKVQLNLNSKRTKSFRLVGFENDRLQTEDFRNDAMDAAELAAEEAGVALYQVQPLPQGEGDLGEVSVRFRDTATDRMVERSWSIPYDAAAPAFDRAPLSMQLSGMAMLCAEKLNRSPYSSLIEFGNFSPTRNRLKQGYPNDPRVAALLEMIDNIK